MEVPRLGSIRAVAAGLHHSHSNAGSKPHLQPTPRPQQCQILNPLSEARDQTYVFLNTGRVLNLLCHNGNSLDIVILVGSVQCYDKPLQRGLYLPKFKIYVLFTPVILLHGKIYPTSVLRWCRKVSIM